MLSGAGPAVMILYSGDESEIDQIPSLASGFTAMKLAIAQQGIA